MLIHGGKGESNDLLSDLHSLRLGDGDVMEWESLVVTGEIPPPIFDHILVNISFPPTFNPTQPNPRSTPGDLPTAAAAAYHAVATGMDLFVLVGGSTPKLRLLNDVHCLRLDQATPSTDASSLSAFTLHFTWSKVQVDGVPPTPRHFCSVCLVNDAATAIQPHVDRHHRIIIFGGVEGLRSGENDRYLSDVHVLKIDKVMTSHNSRRKWHWHAPKCSITPHLHTSTNTDTSSDIMMLLLPPPSYTLLPDMLGLLRSCQSTALTPGGGDVIFVVHPAKGSDDDEDPNVVYFHAHRAIVCARRCPSCLVC